MSEVQAQAPAVDYAGLYPKVRELAAAHPEVVNFAYFLYFFGYYQPQDPEQSNCSYKMKVNFCSTAPLKASSTAMDTSRLEQVYSSFFFSDHYCTSDYDTPEDSIFNSTRQRCKMRKTCPAAGCPYGLAHYLCKYAAVLNRDPQVLFDDLLGSRKIPFAWADEAPIDLDPEDIKGIDAKSAHGAYDLLKTRVVSVEYSNQMVVAYNYVPLCRKQDRGDMIGRYVDMWYHGKGESDTLILNDRDNALNSKREGCRRCGYAQCPDKLAAYFISLSKKYGRPAVDIAYQVARKNTYAGLSMQDNYQFNRFLNGIQQSDLRAEDKARFAEILHYITSHSRNSRIPFLPFNMAVSAPDPASAEPLLRILNNALWYFTYFPCSKDDIYLETIYYSAYSFNGLLEYYDELKPGTAVLLYDVELLGRDEDFQNGYHKLLRLMEEKKNTNFTILCDTKLAIQTFLANYPELKRRIFTRTFEMEDFSNEKILDVLEDKLVEILEIPEAVKEQLYAYIKMAYPSAPQRSMEYVDLLYEQIMFKHFNANINAGDVLLKEDIPYIKPPRTEQEIFDELNRLTGLENVKQELKNINDLIRFNMKMEKNDKERINLHMVFSGNAGTGKTTVARLTAEILYSIGFIQENKLVICSGKDLVAKYVGQTAPLTAQKCASAYNGVLFIDEAYQLNPYTGGRADTFKEECIAELIQQMENNRDKLVVIFAGYTAEMEEFLDKANTGLRSRIAKIIEFPDYSTDELLQILEGIAGSNQMKLDDGAREKARQIFDQARLDSARLGNARFARNLFERSLIQHAALTKDLSKGDPELYVLHGEEITMPSAAPVPQASRPRIGFQ